MSHKDSFSLGGHSVKSDIGGTGHSERHPKILLMYSQKWTSLLNSSGRPLFIKFLKTWIFSLFAKRGKSFILAVSRVTHFIT